MTSELAINVLPVSDCCWTYVFILLCTYQCELPTSPQGLRGVGGALAVNIIPKGWQASSVLYKQCQQAEIIIVNFS